MPLNQQIGTNECIASGETIADALEISELTNGFVSSCFVPAVALNPVWDAASTWQSCSLQYFYGKMIEWTYTASTSLVTTAFQMLLGPAATVRYWPGSDILPDMHTVVTTQCSVIVIDGTTQFQQLALQAFLGITDPQDYGLFSTSPLWYTASQTAATNLQAAGADPAKPIMIAGHSYGAAVAAILYARLYHANPTRPLGAITFGIPKPGDARLRDFFRTTNTLHLANDNDIVTTLGPDAFELAPILALLPIPILSNWTNWKRPFNQTLMLADGTLRPNTGAILDSATLLTLANDALSHIQPNPITGHFMSTYLSRIQTRCPDAEYPVSPALLAFLNQPQSMLLEDLTPMLLEDLSDMLLEN